MITKTCEICGKTFYVGNHRNTTAKYCSLKCKGIGSRLKTKICPTCGKSFWRKNMRKTQVYCSRECSQTGRRKGIKTKCEWCEKDIYKSKSLYEKASHHFCSQDCANAWQGRNKVSFICKICGKGFKWSPSRVENHTPTYCSILCRNKDPDYIDKIIKTNYLQQTRKPPNKLEIAGNNLLLELGIGYKTQVLISGKFTVDVFVPPNLIVQWDGEYWHGHPTQAPFDERQIKRMNLDKSQDAYMRKCGYKILRFWSREVYNIPEMVKEKIMEDLNDNH